MSATEKVGQLKTRAGLHSATEPSTCTTSSEKQPDNLCLNQSLPSTDSCVSCQQQPGKQQKASRTLTDEEKLKLERDTQLVSDFKQGKLEREAQKNWDLFYKRNTTKFYKDRHWTLWEFEELCRENDQNKQLVVLEVGCGVGNFIFPLIEETPHFFYACDFSPRAVQFVQENPLYSERRCKAFWSDITSSPLTDSVPGDSVDIVSMVFVLSAIHPDKMLSALSNIHSVLKPGGAVLFRDYGLYDHAQLRFSSGHKLQENFYVRQDGTRAYYFAVESLSKLFQDAGFEEVANSYVHRETVNKKEGLCVPRVFVQAKFRKLREKNLTDSGADEPLLGGIISKNDCETRKECSS